MLAEQVVPSDVFVMDVNVAGIVGFVVLPSRNAKTSAMSPGLNEGRVALLVPAATPT